MFFFKLSRYKDNKNFLNDQMFFHFFLIFFLSSYQNVIAEGGRFELPYRIHECWFSKPVL